MAQSLPGLVIVLGTQLLYRNVQRLRGGLVFKAHRLCLSLNSRLESNKEEEKKYSTQGPSRVIPCSFLEPSVYLLGVGV